MAKAKKVILPTSFKMPEQLKQRLDDWLWINRRSLNDLMNEIVEDFLNKHPLSKEEQEFIKKQRQKKG
jgi:hypothetical protein